MFKIQVQMQAENAVGLARALTGCGPVAQGVHAVDLDKVPTVQWTNRKEIEQIRETNFSRRRMWAAELHFEYTSNFVPLEKVRCAQCWKIPTAPAKKCAGCLLTEYCSKECHSLHWRQHKDVCQLPAF